MAGVIVPPLAHDVPRNGHCRDPSWLGHDDACFAPPPTGDGVLEDVLWTLRQLARAGPTGHHHHPPVPERFDEVTPYGSYWERIARGPHPAAPVVGIATGLLRP